jgi:hypothetical protein
MIFSSWFLNNNILKFVFAKNLPFRTYLTRGHLLYCKKGWSKADIREVDGMVVNHEVGNVPKNEIMASGQCTEEWDMATMPTMRPPFCY